MWTVCWEETKVNKQVKRRKKLLSSNMYINNTEISIFDHREIKYIKIFSP